MLKKVVVLNIFVKLWNFFIYKSWKDYYILYLYSLFYLWNIINVFYLPSINLMHKSINVLKKDYLKSPNII